MKYLDFVKLRFEFSYEFVSTCCEWPGISDSDAFVQEDILCASDLSTRQAHCQS